MKNTQLKKALCAILATMLMLTATGCQQATTEDTTSANNTQSAAEQTAESETTSEESKSDSKTAEETAEESSPIERNSPYVDEPITLTAEEQEAMKKEPAYGKTIRYWLSDGCTSGPVVADKLGYYAEAGLTAEGVKGTSYTEALGTGSAEVAVGHIATMLVPCTNGVDLTFVGGAHIGCKSLYVLADSEYQSTSDMVGTKIAVPNGIGASDYNITSLLLDADGINPQQDVELIQVETSACVAAMESGEISGALLSDTFAYHMVEEGKLRCVRSLTWDEDFQQEPCCIIAMNATYVKENPIHAKVITACVKRAHNWMRSNPEEATQLLIDEGLNSEDFDMNVELNQSLYFGLSDDFTEAGLKDIASDYIRLGLITATDDLDTVMEKAWNPQCPEE